MGIIGEVVDPIISAALQKKKEKKHSAGGEEEDTLLQYLVRQTSGMFPSSNRCARDLWDHRPQIY